MSQRTSDKLSELKSLGAPSVIRVDRDAFFEERAYAICKGGIFYRTDNWLAVRPHWERYILPDETEPPPDILPPPPYIRE